MFGTIQESEIIEDAESFEALRSMFELVQTSEALVCLFDQTDRLRMANTAFRHALFLEENEQPTWEEMMRRNFHLNRGTKINDVDLETWLSSAISRRGKSPHRNIEVDLCDGRWFSMNETVLPNGWMLCIATDVTQLGASERALRIDRDQARKAANTDPLTGISNRRHIMTLLDQKRLGQTSTGKASGHACLLDIDCFKVVNDTHGHQVGDQVLVEVARCIRRTIGVSDCLGRVGGEEFLVLLESGSTKECKLVMDRILMEIRGLRPTADKPMVQVTASAGLVRFDEGSSSEKIYAACDAALYEAKWAGRDQLVLGGLPERMIAT